MTLTLQELDESREKYSNLHSENTVSKLQLEQEIAELKRRLAEVTEMDDGSGEESVYDDDAIEERPDSSGEYSLGVTSFKIHSIDTHIVRPWGWAIRCLLWLQSLISVALLSLLFWVQYHINPCGAEAGIYWENEVNAMAADALTPSVTRPSAAMVLTK